MTSHRSRALDVHVSGASAPDAIAARRRRGMAQRRMRALGVLAVSDLVVLIAAIASGAILLWTLQVFLDVAAVMFVVHLRRMATLAAAARRRAARQQRDRRRLEEALAEPETAEPRWEEGITVRRPAPADGVFDQTALSDDEVVAPAVNDGFFDQETDLATPATPEPSFVEAGTRRAEPPAAKREELPEAPAAETVGGSPWEPVPVPRPTYAMKPAAPPRPARRRVSEPILPPVETVAEIEADDDLEAILDRRWAVND
ncbi:MAG TPA: hypothetical protein VHC43_13415 [Mycobacteriales bacterium]|nr:hypothetical protein [Mycobacteriales bacterium]